ncbi:hypothetical protein VOI32_03070 [Paraburkholderia caribensis]|uniref:Uncharacterized protein n=1 Tax=Paraburkholderia caribensis TaxID=75105 RepID=A0A9Q6S7I7_9BURK|nr:hypothetical protein [Paraburkholderia caribensis]MCO4882980.1 hypothetical protein [Paraburkholderia caribensis]PTB30677.1 hypothetical protein C9I56_00180 [Paraburkholderia caribensis]QLB65579.1 hypothetical protein A9O66_24705 [Paraburkholderia caribensis]
MARVEFDVSDSIVSTVARIEGLFNNQGIPTSINALHLFALTLHAQQEENPGRAVRIDELLDALFRDDAFFDYYRSTYGDRKLTFNRALHVVHHLGELSKFPWTPTPD